MTATYSGCTRRTALVDSAVEPGLAAATADVQGEVFPPAGRDVHRDGSRGESKCLGESEKVDLARGNATCDWCTRSALL